MVKYMIEKQLQTNATFKTDSANSFFMSGCVAFYSSLISIEDIKQHSRIGLFFLFLFNSIYHVYEFGIGLTFLVLHIAYAILRATLFNVIFILGGFLSQSIYYNTGKYNQLAIRSILYLILNSAAFVKEEISLLIGLIFPRYILSTIKENNDMPRTNKDLYESQYLYCVYSIGKFLQQYKFFKLSNFVTSLLAEPVDTIVHGIKMLFTGWKKEYHVHGANPTFLTATQKEITPILFLHGKGHNQAIFEPLLRANKTKTPNRPVFTLNLLDSDTEEQRQNSIKNKIEEIRNLYGNTSIEPAIIGHGTGADDAAKYKLSTSTRTIYVLLGASQYTNNTLDYHIEAEYDEITPLTDNKHEPHQGNNFFKCKSGHLGLLTDPEVINKIFATHLVG